MAPTKSSNSTVVVKVVPQKLRRNERERKRVNQVNQGFNRLRERVPRQPGCKQKLSKVETLREAARYIQRLQIQLGIPTTSNPLTYDNFPTPENSPNYPPPIHSNIQSTSNSQHVSPFYPNPQDFQKYAAHNNFQSQISPGSSSFYSNSDAGSNYEENYMQS